MLTRVVSFLRRRLGLNLCRLFVRAPPALRGEARAVAGPFEYRLAREAELLEAARDVALEIDAGQVRAAFRSGDLCVGCFEAGRLVGYLWYAFGSAPHGGGLRVEFDSAAERYAYRAFTHPRYRRRGVGEALFSLAGEICPRHGRTLDVCLVYVDNPASLRAVGRAGWRVAGYAGYLQRPGVFFGFRSGGARRLGVRFTRRRPPARRGLSPSPHP